MRLSFSGLNFIKSFEGFSATPYHCAAGYLTIGYGHAVKAGENFKEITESEALHILSQDVQIAENGIQRLIQVSLTQNQFDALCSFTFNLGSGALQRSTLRRKINYGEFLEAADEFLRWIKAEGRILPGLIKRRKQERLLFLS